MNRAIVVITLVVLGACGADGEPIRPSLNAGMLVGSGHVGTSASIGLHTGNLGIRIGL